MSLHDRRVRMTQILDSMTEGFEELEALMSDFQKRFGVRGLLKGNNIMVQPIPGYEGISLDYYQAADGRFYEIRINRRPTKTRPNAR